ncbi:MAG: YpdA family putative bacillithiol disulfide reductase, partial [Nevskiales bacterium]
MSQTYDVICIGAGPTGLACAIEAKRAGMKPLVIDKGCLCNSLFHYPTNMVFFTTPELIEIGDLPMVCAGEKPTRSEALKYYRRCAEHDHLDLRLYEGVLRVTGQKGKFAVHTQTQAGTRAEYSCANVVIATGYYDLPNLLEIPGEELPHVSHYYREPHAHWNQDVVVIGGKNSAALAALDLYRAGVRVTLIHRRAGLSDRIKYWIRPDIENRIKAGEVKAVFNSRVTRIERDRVWVTDATREQAISASAVYALSGYHPDFEFLRQQGVFLDPQSNRPEFNPQTHETNVPGIYLAGVVIGGNHT